MKVNFSGSGHATILNCISNILDKGGGKEMKSRGKGDGLAAAGVRFISFSKCNVPELLIRKNLTFSVKYRIHAI
jgi:hypothetical protein